MGMLWAVAAYDSAYDTADAKRILDEVRENFSRIRHQAESVDFFVTFSCGISSCPKYATPADITNAADHALYEAKDKGQNRVVVG